MRDSPAIAKTLRIRFDCLLQFRGLSELLCFLRGVNQPFGESFLERRTRPADIQSLPFKIKFQALPNQFESEFKALDHSVAHNVALGLRYCFPQAPGGIL